MNAPGHSAKHAWDGRVIDRRYRILRQLGEGAMGAVFVAEHLNLHKQVALKVVRAEYAGNREVLARFAREALAGSRIDHPSVVAALDYGSLEEGGAYLVMPLVVGKCLTDIFLERGRLPWPEAVELGAQIADALAAAWDKGFVHRDLKPDNILVEQRDPEGPLARVIDFGIAKLAQLSGAGRGAPGAGPALTKEGAIMGTPGYMAPEQALGRTATHAADLYSLGVVLWEALVGQPRWTGDTVQAILRAQLRETRPSVREACPDAAVPLALDRLIERLVSVRPEERPETARDVRDQLREIVRHAAVAPTRAVSMPARVTSQSPFRHRVWSVLTATALAGCLLGGFLALAPATNEAAGTGAESLPSGLSAELEPVLHVLAHDDSKTAREAAARRLLKQGVGTLPEYAERLARLELAKSCSDKKAVLSSLLRLDDPRAQAGWMRLASEPKTGCGPR
ncbi:MAG TPA: serine/threonine-protein kinase, partial [Polyangiaceae bacterium]|nr:serine/threonine-protein kinase [Polyangiaceae bacterium]